MVKKDDLDKIKEKTLKNIEKELYFYLEFKEEIIPWRNEKYRLKIANLSERSIKIYSEKSKVDVTEKLLTEIFEDELENLRKNSNTQSRFKIDKELKEYLIIESQLQQQQAQSRQPEGTEPSTKKIKTQLTSTQEASTQQTAPQWESAKPITDLVDEKDGKTIGTVKDKSFTPLGTINKPKREDLNFNYHDTNKLSKNDEDTLIKLMGDARQEASYEALQLLNQTLKNQFDLQSEGNSLILKVKNGNKLEDPSPEVKQKFQELYQEYLQDKTIKFETKDGRQMQARFTFETENQKQMEPAAPHRPSF